MKKIGLTAIVLMLLSFASINKSTKQIEYKECMYPETLQDFVQSIIPDSMSTLVLTIISVESNWDIYASSGTNDYGLMQINERYWSKQFDFERIYEPEYNVNAGIYILNQCLAKSNGDIRLALKYYNGGSSYPSIVNNKHKELFNEYLFD